MTMTTERPLAEQMLYKLQARALTDDAAASECARRYAVGSVRHADSTVHINKIIKSYLAGLHGEPDEYGGGKGYNFAAPYRSAHRAGAHLRRELSTNESQ